MTAVEWFFNEIKHILPNDFLVKYEQAQEMEKEQKIKILKSLVYSVCIGDDVEDVEEWLKEHELNKSE